MSWTTFDDAVTRALATVRREDYTQHPRLGGVAQSTIQWAIERDLRRAAIQPGMRVLEIGTGTGLTGALLAEIVGPTGHVVSMDIDPALTARAAEIHAERGVSNLTVLTGDGRYGAEEHGPFDAIVGWAAPTHIPLPWVRQCRPGAVISTPIYLAPVARMVGHIRVTVTEDGHPTGPELSAAAYIDMGGRINTTPGVPMFYLDARQELPGGDLAWLSVAWREHRTPYDPADTLCLLLDPDYVESIDLGSSAEERWVVWRNFRAYCAGRDTRHAFASLTTYGVIGRHCVSGIGFSNGIHVAVLTADGRILADHAGSPARAALIEYYQEWKLGGRIGLSALTPILEEGPDGWYVRVVLSPHGTSPWTPVTW